MLAPYILREVRVVDKRIAVMLEIRHRVHTPYLFDRHRVLAVPLNEHFLFPRLELQIIIVLHGEFRTHIFVVEPPALVLRENIIDVAVGPVTVTSSHIEIRTSEITFVLIFGLEHPEIDIQRLVVLLAHLQRAGVGLEVFLRHTKRIVAAGTVRRGVRGVQMVTILIGIVLCPAPP